MKRIIFSLFILLTVRGSAVYAQQSDEVNFKLGRGNVTKDPNPSDSVFFSLKEANVHRGRVKELSLEGIGLVQFPPEIFKYKNLEVLNLSYNALENVPDSLFIYCPRLHTVRFAGNDWTQIPPALFCAALKVMDLSENRLKEIPETIARCKQLEELDVHANDINKFPTHEICLRNLRSLVLSDNPIGRLAPWIVAQTGLKILFLEKVKLTEWSNEVCALKELRLLNIEENELKDFPSCLCTLQSLKVLMVYESGLSKQQLEKMQACNPKLILR